MKPDAPEGIRRRSSRSTPSVPGIRICDQMPLSPSTPTRRAIVRSLSHGSNNHEPSVYHMLTGRTNPTLVVPTQPAEPHATSPFFGSVVSHFTPPGAMPAA